MDFTTGFSPVFQAAIWQKLLRPRRRQQWSLLLHLYDGN